MTVGNSHLVWETLTHEIRIVISSYRWVIESKRSIIDGIGNGKRSHFCLVPFDTRSRRRLHSTHHAVFFNHFSISGSHSIDTNCNCAAHKTQIYLKTSFTFVFRMSDLTLESKVDVWNVVGASFTTQTYKSLDSKVSIVLIFATLACQINRRLFIGAIPFWCTLVIVFERLACCMHYLAVHWHEEMHDRLWPSFATMQLRMCLAFSLFNQSRAMVHVDHFC